MLEAGDEAPVIEPSKIQQEQDNLICYMMRFLTAYHVICLYHTLKNVDQVSMAAKLYLLSKNGLHLAINTKMSTVNFEQKGTYDSTNTRCLHNKFRLFSVLICF